MIEIPLGKEATMDRAELLRLLREDDEVRGAMVQADADKLKADLMQAVMESARVGRLRHIILER